jgi:protocatechuate 3,4-dioxygenase beta subunit
MIDSPRTGLRLATRVAVFPLLTVAVFTQTRDTPAPVPGTAVIRGRVIADDTSLPLRNARVQLTLQNVLKFTTTDGDGRYEIKGLPPGRYTVSALKGGYLQLQFGQKRPFESGTPVQAQNDRITQNVDFSLPRAAVIKGRVLDEFGEPTANVQVTALRNQFTSGTRQLLSVRSATTNDIGEFRLFDLPPGQYYLAAFGPFGTSWEVVGSTWFGSSTQAPRNSAPTYFPGTASVAEAQRIPVGIGQTVNDISIVLVQARTARVTGTAVDSTGKPFGGLPAPGAGPVPAFGIAAIPRQSVGAVGTVRGFVGSEGHFAVSGLAPGDYTLKVTGSSNEFASANITVAGADIDNVRIVGVKPSTISGRLVIDLAAGDSRPTLSTVQVALVVLHPEDASILGNAVTSKVNENLTFELKTGPGAWRVAGSGAGWGLRVVRHHGADVTDSGIDIRPGEDVSGLEVELTNRMTRISGRVTTSNGEAAKDAAVEIFSQDSARWTTVGYMRMVRSDQNGGYTTTGLRPGPYYAIALDDLEPGESSAPEFLERIRSRAQLLSLTEGEPKTLDLRLVTN